MSLEKGDAMDLLYFFVCVEAHLHCGLLLLSLSVTVKALTALIPGCRSTIAGAISFDIAALSHAVVSHLLVFILILKTP